MIDTNVHPISEAVEAQLDHLRRGRPGLASRITRAENILATHLSCKRAKLIKVRVDSSGRPRFLVSGSNGAVYVVDPSSWSCSCPDAHRHGTGCKHALACWVLSKSGGSGPHSRTTAACDGCNQRFAHRDLFDAPPGHEMFFEGERMCQSCAQGGCIL